MFRDKGIITKSALAKNIKVTIGFYPDNRQPDELQPLVKITAKRLKKSENSYRYINMHKTWLDVREAYAVLSALERTLMLVEDYYEGTLDPQDILVEDEDLRGLVATEASMNPSIDDLINLDVELTKAVDHQLGDKKKED